MDVRDLVNERAGAIQPWLVAAGVLLVVALSPILASWSTALANGMHDHWWWPRAVSVKRWAIVAVTGTSLALVATAGRPWLAWVLLAAAGAVLIVVDAQRHLLPARLVYPLAITEAAVLIATAIANGEGDRLLRAFLAAASVTAIWLVILFAAPSAFGLGDVRLFGLTAGLLGWASWWAVLYGELAAFLLAGAAAIALLVGSPAHRHRRAPVPMGPAIVVGAMIVCWL